MLSHIIPSINSYRKLKNIVWIFSTHNKSLKVARQRRLVLSEDDAEEMFGLFRMEVWILANLTADGHLKETDSFLDGPNLN